MKLEENNIYLESNKDGSFTFLKINKLSFDYKRKAGYVVSYESITTYLDHSMIYISEKDYIFNLKFDFKKLNKKYWYEMVRKYNTYCMEKCLKYGVDRYAF